jgi:amidase
MLYVNPKVLEQADAMDKQLKRGTKLKPLQCIPVVLKDNFDTADMPTTGASLALKGMQPAEGCVHRGALAPSRSPDSRENEPA